MGSIATSKVARKLTKISTGRVNGVDSLSVPSINGSVVARMNVVSLTILS